MFIIVKSSLIMKYKLLTFILVFVFISCDSEDNPFDHTSKSKILLLKKTIREDEYSIRTYEYVYSDNKLIRVNYEHFKKSSNSYSYYKFEFEYISENEFYRYYYIDDELSSKYRYFKPNPNFVRREKLDPLSNELQSYELWDIGNSCGITKYYSYDNNNILVGFDETNFYDSNCSSNVSLYDGDGNFMGIQRSVKDNKKSPYTTLYGNNFYRINTENQHNTIEWRQWDENNILESSNKSTFEYNKEGYPTFEEIIYPYSDGTTSVKTVYYEYY